MAIYRGSGDTGTATGIQSLADEAAASAAAAAGSEAASAVSAANASAYAAQSSSWASAAAASATAAAASETAAAASETAAAASETAAAASETAAAASETAAAASAAAAAASAVDAANTSTEQINPVTNGQFDIWQRGTSFTSMGPNTYVADRWLHVRDGSGATMNFTRNPWAPGHGANTWGAPYYAIFNCTVAGTGETYNNLQQRFEDVGLFGGQEITLSFVAHSPSGDQVIDRIIWLQNFGSGGSTQVVTTVSSGTETISGSTWSQHSITFTPPSISGKTVGANANSRIVFQIALNATFGVYFSNVQIDVGPNAKPIKRADVPTELIRCQRFYENSSNNGTTLPSTAKQGNVGHVLAATVTAGNWLYRDVRFKVKKRTTPTVTLSTSGIAGGNGYVNVNGVARLAIAADVGENGFGSIQNNSAVSWTDQQGLLFNYEADAEL